MSVTATADAVVFRVSDSGLGIPEEDLPRIFTAFFRGERSRSRGTGGVGLGLTLAKRIVDAHGGTISVKSASGEGTTVTVQVPRHFQRDRGNSLRWKIEPVASISMTGSPSKDDVPRAA